MKGFLITLAVTAVAIVIVTYILPAVKFANPEDHVPQLVILAVLIGLVNSLIKPIAGILSFPINAMTLGLFGLVVNGLFLLLIAYVANTYFDVPFTIAGFPNSGLSVDVFDQRDRGRRADEPDHDGHRARRPGLASVTPDALRAAARRFGTPVYVTSVAALDAAEAELRGAFPDPWLRAYSVKANDVPAIIRRLGERGLAANVVSSGEWAAARKAGIGNDADHARGHRQDARRPPGRGAGGRRRRSAALGGRGEPGGARGAGWRWPGGPGSAVGAGRRSTSSSASTRTWRPRPTPASPSAAAPRSSA